MKTINFSLLTNRFKNLTALDVIEILCQTFGASGAYIRRCGKLMPLTDLYDDVEMFSQLASEVEIDFYGGPPPSHWWSGTLLTLLMDHCVYAYSKNDLHRVRAALKVTA